MLAQSSDFWLDDCWIVDSTPVPCGMSRPTVKRSDVHPAVMPILWALADPKIGEREVLAAILEADADVAAEHEGILLICDKGFVGKDFEALVSEYGITMLRPLPQGREGPLRRTDAQDGFTPTGPLRVWLHTTPG